MDPERLAEQAESAMRSLAEAGSTESFSLLIRLSAVAGECLGTCARALAEDGSWAGVADIAGTTRQAAWSRWHSPTP